MSKNTAIRNTNHKHPVPFHFFTDEVTINNAKQVADAIDMSLAAFVRQSLKRNIKQYQSVNAR